MGAVAEGVFGIVVYLNHQSVSSRSRSRKCHGQNQIGNARRVAGVYDDGKMGQALEKRNRRKVQGISRCRFKCSDSSLAEDDVAVAPCHDVFCTHEEFLKGAGKASLEKNGLFQGSQFFQKFEVLHVSSTNLNDIHVVE